MTRARLVRRRDAVTQALPISEPPPAWDLRQLSDAELEALLPLVARLEQEGPEVPWLLDEAQLLEQAWITATTAPCAEMPGQR